MPIDDILKDGERIAKARESSHDILDSIKTATLNPMCREREEVLLRKLVKNIAVMQYIADMYREQTEYPARILDELKEHAGRVLEEEKMTYVFEPEADSRY